jgi:hypothetical protein
MTGKYNSTQIPLLDAGEPNAVWVPFEIPARLRLSLLLTNSRFHNR